MTPVLFPVFAEMIECISDPCQNAATCHDVPSGYECECAAGYNLTHCEGGKYLSLQCVDPNSARLVLNLNIF